MAIINNDGILVIALSLCVIEAKSLLYLTSRCYVTRMTAFLEHNATYEELVLMKCFTYLSLAVDFPLFALKIVSPQYIEFTVLLLTNGIQF